MRLGRYDLGRVLGTGASGRVYEAELVGPGGLRKPVAVKVLRVAMDNPRREARLGGLLRHRNLVDVYEVGEVDGRWFTAMELCAGSLVDHVPLPPRAVVEVGLAVCDALQYAHEELGLVHLDIKPANLLVSRDGVVKVADLGIARAKGFEALRGVAGTPGFMAPEQRAGGAVDARTDIHALGVTLLMLAIGVDDPYTRTFLTTCTSPVTVDTLSEMPDVDWLNEVVGRCIAADPDARWPDMATLAEALRALDVEGPGLAEVLGMGPQPMVDRHALPTREALFGRDALVADLLVALRERGLVRLRGAPGVGKSRLALELAHLAAADGREVVWCEATEVHTVEGLVFAIGRALDVPLPPDASVDHLGHALGSLHRPLLVLDGLDGLARADVPGRLSALVPEASVVVTARVTGTDGRVFEVPPLDEAAAVALVRARAAARGVEADDDPALNDLVARLDGLPLALELAAGRLGVLDAREVLEHLAPSFLRRNTDGHVGALDRVLHDSWRSLPPAGQLALAALSVFAGGCTLEAADDVIDAPDTLDLLDVLEAHSLIRFSRRRVQLFSTIQAFASERLEGEEGARAHTRHGRHYARLGPPDLAERLDLAEGPPLLEACVTDLDNLVSACHRAVARRDEAVAMATLRAAVAVWTARGPLVSVLGLIEVVATLPLSPAARVEVARARASALHRLGRLEEAARLLTDTLTRVSDVVQRSQALRELAMVRMRQGRHDDARELLARATPLVEAAGAPRLAAALALDLGTLCTDARDVEGAMRHLSRALELASRHGLERVVGVAHINLANARSESDQPSEAAEGYGLALAIHRRRGDRRWIAIAEANLGILAYEQGWPEARNLLESALASSRRLGSRILEANVLGNLGLVLTSAGDLRGAASCYTEALAAARAFGSQAGVRRHMANLAITAHQLGDLDMAATSAQEALTMARASGEALAVTSSLCILAPIRIDQGRVDDARDLLEEALTLARGLGPVHVGQVGTQLADLYHHLGDTAQAEAMALEAVEAGRTHARPMLEAQARARLALIRWHRDDHAQAEVDAAVQVLERQYPARASAVLVFVADRHRHDGRLDAARAALARATALVPDQHELVRDRIRALEDKLRAPGTPTPADPS